MAGVDEGASDDGQVESPVGLEGVEAGAGAGFEGNPMAPSAWARETRPMGAASQRRSKSLERSATSAGLKGRLPTQAKSPLKMFQSCGQTRRKRPPLKKFMENQRGHGAGFGGKKGADGDMRAEGGVAERSAAAQRMGSRATGSVRIMTSRARRRANRLLDLIVCRLRLAREQSRKASGTRVQEALRQLMRMLPSATRSFSIPSTGRRTFPKRRSCWRFRRRVRP